MILYQEKHCDACNKVTGHFNGRCGECIGRKEYEERQAYIHKCSSMSLEERIESLEDWRYNLTLEENRNSGYDS